MGWRIMGASPRRNSEGQPSDYKRVRNGSNAGAFDKNKSNLDAGAATRFKQTVVDPSVGDRFGQLTVMGNERVKQGAAWTRYARVRCDCGAPPHLVYMHNLLKGASTRCNACAKKSAGYWRKDWYAYAGVCPDDDIRRRLLNRISAAITRCTSPKHRQWAGYGGRGITVYAVWLADKAKFLAYLVSLEGHDNPLNDMDRINVDQGYAPGNIRFISRGENRGGNKRTVHAMQIRIHELESRIRHLEQRPPQSIYDTD